MRLRTVQKLFLIPAIGLAMTWAAAQARAGEEAAPFTHPARVAPGPVFHPVFEPGRAVPNFPWSANILLACDTGNGFSPPDGAIAVNGNTVFVTMNYFPGNDPGNNNFMAWEVSRSTDRGVTWQAPLVLRDSSGGDPCLFAGGPDTTYLVEKNSSFTGLLWVRTTDGGNSWSAPATLISEGSLDDKERLVIDTVNTNYIYCQWVNFGSNYGDMHFSRSTNKGTTWSTPIIINDGAGSGYRTGAAPWVGRGPYSGHVYCVWQDGRLGGDGRICFKKSTDHGATFPGSEVTVADIHLVPGHTVISNWRFPMHPDPASHPCPYPSVATDSQGRIFVCYNSAPTAGSSRNFDPLVTVSTNEGTTWSAPVSANMAVSGDTADQYLPWLCVGPNDVVHVFWCDMRNYNDLNGDLYYACSTDHGATFSTPEMINDATPCLYGSVANYDQGDFNLIAADTGRVYVEWCDNRTRGGVNYQDVDVAYRDFPNGVELNPVANPALPPKFALGPAVPNPSDGNVDISYDLPAETQVSLKVYNLSGQVVRTLTAGKENAGTRHVTWDGLGENGVRAASGVYFYRLEAGSYSATQKLVMVR